MRFYYYLHIRGSLAHNCIRYIYRTTIYQESPVDSVVASSHATPDQQNMELSGRVTVAAALGWTRSSGTRPTTGPPPRTLSGRPMVKRPAKSGLSGHSPLYASMTLATWCASTLLPRLVSLSDGTINDNIIQSWFQCLELRNGRCAPGLTSGYDSIALSGRCARTVQQGSLVLFRCCAAVFQVNRTKHVSSLSEFSCCRYLWTSRHTR